MFDLRFIHPFNAIIAAPSGSGKTRWLKNLLTERDKLISDCPKNIVLFYQEMQPIYDEMVADKLITHMIQGFPSLEDLRELAISFKQKGESLMIFDDALQFCNSDVLETFFTVISHHQKSSGILVTQSLFFQSKTYRNMSLNTHYLVVFKSPRDSRQISTLASQMRPGSSGYIVDSFEKATRRPYGYFIMDFRQLQSDAVRYRTNIFNYEFPPLCFIQNSSKGIRS